MPETFPMWWRQKEEEAPTRSCRCLFLTFLQNSFTLSLVDSQVCGKWGTFQAVVRGSSALTSGVYRQRCHSFDVFISSTQDVPTHLQYGGTQLPAYCHICA